MSSSVPAPLRELVVVGQGRLGRTVTEQLRSTGLTVHAVHRGMAIPPGCVTWLTVPDGVIPDVADRCREATVLLHASGAKDLAVLGDHPCGGSLHPLMTFPGGAPPPPPVPAAVAGTADARAVAHLLADRLGWTPFEVLGDRRAYHAAAVVAGNFATALLAEAAKLLSLAGVPEAHAPALLAPLALQSLQNAARLGPAKALTGPVVRGDDAIIDDHLAVLDTAPPGIRDTYRTLLAATRRLAAPQDDNSC